MEIFCYGDSHTKYFGESTMLRWGGFVPIEEPKVRERSMMAASARGLANAETSRFVFKKLQRLVDADNPIWVCMNLGLVDADAGIYYRKYVKQSDISAEADFAQTYADYVKTVRQILPDQTIVFKGLNPSTIAAQHYFDNYVQTNITKRIPDQKIRAQVAERMETDKTTIKAHGELNCLAAELLKDAVEKAGFVYFDLRKDLESADRPGICRDEFLPGPHDNHIVDNLMARKLHRRGVINAMNDAAGVKA